MLIFTTGEELWDKQRYYILPLSFVYLFQTYDSSLQDITFGLCTWKHMLNLSDISDIQKAIYLLKFIFVWECLWWVARVPQSLGSSLNGHMAKWTEYAKVHFLGMNVAQTISISLMLTKEVQKISWTSNTNQQLSPLLRCCC